MSGSPTFQESSILCRRPAAWGYSLRVTARASTKESASREVGTVCTFLIYIEDGLALALAQFKIAAWIAMVNLHSKKYPLQTRKVAQLERMAEAVY